MGLINVVHIGVISAVRMGPKKGTFFGHFWSPRLKSGKSRTLGPKLGSDPILAAKACSEPNLADFGVLLGGSQKIENFKDLDVFAKKWGFGGSNRRREAAKNPKKPVYVW